MAKKFEDNRPSHDEIAQRAYELFEKSGRAPGHDMDHWLEAERQLVAASKSQNAQPTQPAPTQRPAVTTSVSAPAAAAQPKPDTRLQARPAQRRM
jgi:Protein of unknown function (DUF2934)